MRNYTSLTFRNEATQAAYLETKLSDLHGFVVANQHDVKGFLIYTETAPKAEHTDDHAFQVGEIKVWKGTALANECRAMELAGYAPAGALIVDFYTDETTFESRHREGYKMARESKFWDA